MMIRSSLLECYVTFTTSDYKPDKKKPDLICKITIQATFITINVEPYEEVPKVILAAQMYGIAEKYAVKDLKDLSVARFLAQIEKTPMSNLPALIDIIYDSTAENEDGCS
jgi:hypothetical protein